MATPAPTLAIGQQVNLVHGIRTNVNNPFWELQRPGPRLATTPVPAPSNVPPTGPVKLETSLVFCDSWSDLLTEYFSGYRIPACCCNNDMMRNSAPFFMQPGQQAAIHKQVADALGIPAELARDDAYTSFAFVRVVKAGAALNSWDATSATPVRNVVTSLPPQADPTQQLDVAPYMDAFQTVGTHFISEVQMGDVAMQAFVYTKDVLAVIREDESFQSSRITDPVAIGLFRNYTAVAKISGSGFTSAKTRVATASNSAAFDAQVVPKLADYTAGLQASIFTLFKDRPAQEAFKPLTDSVPIKISLTPITNLAPATAPGQPSVATPFCSLLDAVLLQKFGRAATHSTAREAVLGLQPDYAALYKTTLPELVTTACTSVVAISQMYFRLDAIHKQRLLYAGDTEQVQVFSDVIEAKGSITLPGNTVTLISRLLLASPDESGKCPVVTFTSKDAFNSFNPVVETVLGTMAVEGPAGSGLRRTFHNGVALVTGAAPATAGGPIEVVLEKTINNSYITAEHLANYNVQLGIQSTLLVAENALNYRFSKGLTSAASQYAVWLKTSLGKLMPDDAAKDALPLDAAVKTEAYQSLGRVAMLLAAPSDGRDNVIVPRLTYKEYSEAIERMTDAAQAYADSLAQSAIKININKSQEATGQLLGALNKNVQAIGQFLLKQNDVNNEKEKDLAAANQTLIDKLTADLASAQAKFSNGKDGLKEKMNAQTVELEAAKKRMEAGVNRAADRAKSELAMNVAGAVFSVAGACMGVGNPFGDAKFTALTATMQTLLTIERVFKILEAIMKIGATSLAFESLKVKFNYSDGKNPVTPTVKFAEMENVKNILPSDLDWNNFDAEVAAKTQPVLALAPEANDFILEAKKMSNIGRAITSNLSTQASLAYSIMVQTVQQDVANKQSDRLQWLQNQLSQPDLPKQKAAEINLFELGTLMEARANRTTLRLLKTLSLQDAALQYAYFQEPARIDKASSLNILDVHDLLVSQANSTINALTTLDAPSNLLDPISYVLPAVPVSDLTGAGYQFNISTASPGIPSFYDRVRINYVEVEFTKNKPTTKSNILVATLNSSADFSDRAPDGSTRQYSAINPANFKYAYNLQTRATTYSNIPTDEFKMRFMQMTPFTKWTLQLPANQQNDGIAFMAGEPTTEVTIRFFCNAIYSSKPQPAMRMLAADGNRAAGTLGSRAIRKRATDAAGAWTNVFDTSVKYDNWVDPATSKVYNVRVELGPLVPTYQFNTEMTRMTVTCMLAVSRLEPVADASAPPDAPIAPHLVLPPGYFRFIGDFAATSDGAGGFGFMYSTTGNNPTQIKIEEANNGWKLLKDAKKKPRYPDQAAVETNRQLVEQAITYYFLKLRSNVKVRALSKPEETEKLMMNKSIMRGWDVVCAFDADQISKLLEEKWKKEFADWQKNPVVHDTDSLGTVFKITTQKTLLATVPDPEDPELDMDLYIEMEALLGPPLISFVSNQPGECSFRMLILEGKTVTTNSKYPERRKEKNLDVGAAAITGTVNLSVLTGVVNTATDGTYGVYIEMERAAFKTIADVPDMQLSSLSLALKTYFTEQMPNKKIFLGAAKMADFCKCDALWPRHFYMTTVRPDLAGPGVLLMFITTNGADGKDRALDVLHNPLKDGYSAAVYVNTRIIYKDILLPQIKEAVATSNLDPSVKDWAEAVQDPTTFCYSIKAKAGIKMNAGVCTAKNDQLGERVSTISRSANVRVPLDQFRVGPGSVPDKISTTFSNVTFDQDVPYCTIATCFTQKGRFTIEKVGFSDLTPQIANTDEQTISLGTWRRTDEEIPISDDYDKGDIWQQFGDLFNNKDKIYENLRNTLKNIFKVTPVSVPNFSLFAVSNLLFPGMKVMDIKQVYCPGDLLIVGNVVKTLYPDGTTSAPAPVTRSTRSAMMHSLGLVEEPQVPGRRAGGAVGGSVPAVTAPVSTLLSDVAGRSVVDPWTLAVAVSIDHINKVLSTSSMNSFPTKLVPEPVIMDADEVLDLPEMHYKLEINGLGNPSLQLVANDTTRMQLTVPITNGQVTQATITIGEDGEPEMKTARPMKFNEGSLVLVANIIETTVHGSYALALDLSAATITSLDFKTTKAISPLVITSLKDKLAEEVQSRGSRLPIAVLNLPMVDDLGHLDTFTYSIIVRNGAGAIVLAAGDSIAVKSKQIALNGLNSLPTPAGSRACVYLSNRVLMQSILLPGIKGAGSTSTAASLLAGAEYQAPSVGSLGTIAGGADKTKPVHVTQTTKIPTADEIGSAQLVDIADENTGTFTVYKISDRYDGSKGVDIAVPLSGLKFGVNGKVAAPGDALTVSWSTTWSQEVDILDRLSYTAKLAFDLTTPTVPGSAPLQLVRSDAAGSGIALQFPAMKLGTPTITYKRTDDDSNRLELRVIKKQADEIIDTATKVLQGVSVPGFTTSSPALGALEYVLANLGPSPVGPVAPDTLRATQAYVPGDLVMVAP